jgi:hypothetical protein
MAPNKFYILKILFKQIMTEEQTSNLEGGNQKAKKSKYLIFGVIVVGLIFLIIFGFGYFAYLEQRETQQIQDSLNTNVDIHNSYLGEINTVNDRLKQLLVETDRIDDQPATEIKIQQLQSFIDTTTELGNNQIQEVEYLDTQKSKLAPGPNQDTQDFKDLVATNLDSYYLVSQSLFGVTEYLACLSQGEITNTNLSLKLESIDQVPEDQFNEDNFAQTAQTNQEIAENLEQIASCYSDLDLDGQDEVVSALKNMSEGLSQSADFINQAIDSGDINAYFINNEGQFNSQLTAIDTASQDLEANTEIFLDSLGTYIDQLLEELSVKSAELRNQRQQIVDKYDLP